MQHSVYSGGDNGVSVEHYRYQGGEHVWSMPLTKAVMFELVWNFVSHDINDCGMFGYFNAIQYVRLCQMMM